MRIRHQVAWITIVGLVGSVLLGTTSSPSFGGKKKKEIQKSFVAQGFPYPVTSGVNEVGCQEGVEGIHKVHHEFKAPWDGFFIGRMEDFTGDWDIVLLDEEGNELSRSDNDNVLGPPEEEISAPVSRGRTVIISPCNWLGEPEVTVTYQFIPYSD